MSRTVVTPVFRGSFINVFTPRKNEQSQKDEWSIKMIFDRDADLSELKKLIDEAIMEKWGTNPPKNLKLPLKDGNLSDLDKYPEDANKYIASAKSTIAPPGVVDRQLQPIMEAKEVYSGCYLRASVTAYAYDHKLNKGVSFGLRNVMKWDEGEPLAGTTKPEDDFAAFAQTGQNDLGI